MFGISLGSEERVISAFNHLKKKCKGNSDTACIRTTLVINNEKSYNVVWKGKVDLNKALCLAAKTILLLSFILLFPFIRLTFH